MLVGLPASGKSTIAKELSEKEGVIIVSYDDVRKKILEDRRDHNNERLVLDEMLRLTVSYLRNGFSVIYDATNIKRRRRKSLLKKLPKEVEKCCIYLEVDETECIKRNARRDYTVSTDSIKKMSKAIQIPTYREGWDCIK